MSNEKKYYFITYRADNRYENSHNIWNQVIDISPMDFVKKLQDAEDKSEKSYYMNFVVLNTCEITEQEYNQYEGEF